MKHVSFKGNQYRLKVFCIHQIGDASYIISCNFHVYSSKKRCGDLPD
jgi:hypothetical protein